MWTLVGACEGSIAAPQRIVLYAPHAVDPGAAHGLAAGGRARGGVAQTYRGPAPGPHMRACGVLSWNVCWNPPRPQWICFTQCFLRQQGCPGHAASRSCPGYERHARLDAHRARLNFCNRPAPTACGAPVSLAPALADGPITDCSCRDVDAVHVHEIPTLPRRRAATLPTSHYCAALECQWPHHGSVAVSSWSLQGSAR